MSKLLNTFNNIFAKDYNNKLDPCNKNYETKLLKKYGNCDEFNKNIKILVIADTHGTLNEDKFKKYLDEIGSYHIFLMLGDHYNRDVEIIIRNVDKSKLFGLLGNHDYDIPNINGKVLVVNNVKILGMQGSFKYKLVDFPSFTQDESMNFFENLEKVDILVSHDKTFDINKLNDPAHQGLIGITNYIYKNNIPINIHGHIHEPYKQRMLNGTLEISSFGYELIEFGGTKNV